MDQAAGRRALAIPSSIVMLLVGFVGMAIWYASASLPKPRNVILISLDTLRPDHLGVYGYSRDTSPNLDLLSQQSFVFDRALAPAPNTPPSQMSMMTSLYPAQHGFTGHNDRLGRQFTTLAERMQASGFRTAGFVDGGFLRARFGFNRGFDVYNQKGGGFAKILPLATNWLEERGDEPFFLFLHTYDIHAPYLTHPRLRDMFIDQPYAGSFVPTADNMWKVFQKKIQLDDADMRYITSRYDQGIRYTDTLLGDFFGFLRDRGYLDDTALIITSDHGEEFGEHGSALHWQLFFQPNLRIPLIIRMPGGMSREIRIDSQVELIDLLPTILDWVGAEPLRDAQGTSLVDTMAHMDHVWQALVQRELARQRPTPTAYAWGAGVGDTPWHSALRGRFQLIFHETKPEADQLFDIEVDPFAQQNLATENTHMVEQMREEGLRILATNRPPDAEATTALDAETEEQLRALGYLQ